MLCFENVNTCNLILPALWAKVVSNPKASKNLSWEGFTPPPTPSPGVWTTPAAGWNRLFSRFLAHPCALLFCIAFSMPSWIDFWSILPPKRTPKWSQNRSKIDPESNPTTIQPKKTKKHKNQQISESLIVQKCTNRRSETLVFYIFTYLVIGWPKRPRNEPKWTQNEAKIEPRWDQQTQ